MTPYGAINCRERAHLALYVPSQETQGGCLKNLLKGVPDTTTASLQRPQRFKESNLGGCTFYTSTWILESMTSGSNPNLQYVGHQKIKADGARNIRLCINGFQDTYNFFIQPSIIHSFFLTSVLTVHLPDQKD